jgi:hypothetical protein
VASVTLSASVTESPEGMPVMLIYAGGQVIGVFRVSYEGGEVTVVQYDVTNRGEWTEAYGG